MLSPHIQIFLVGFMASGKSSIGRLVAQYLNRTFIDTDVYLENRFRKRVSDMFKEVGEEKFRQRETMALQEILGYHNSLVATGGGLPCIEGSMPLMNEHGITIYLKHEPDVLAQRVELCKRTRPKVSHLSGNELLQYVTQTLQVRAPYYEQARIIIPYARICPGEDEPLMAKYIVSLLNDPTLESSFLQQSKLFNEEW